MNVIKYKEKIRKLLPESIFNMLILIWRKSFVVVHEFYRKKRLNHFTHSFFKEIFVWNKYNFFLKISPKNWYVDQTIFIDWIYEENIYNLMIQEIQQWNTCVDIWANIWMYTNFFPQIVSQSWKVIAFEPVLSNYEQNLESITKNKYSNVTLYNFALSDTESEIDIFISDRNLWGSSFNKSSLHTRKEKIKTYTGDSILLKENKIDFIKIDTEWSELQVLNGLVETLKKHTPKIIIEFSPILFKEKEDANKVLHIFQNIYDFVYIIEHEKTLNIKNTRDYKEYLNLAEIDQVNLFFYNKK